MWRIIITFVASFLLVAAKLLPPFFGDSLLEVPWSIVLGVIAVAWCAVSLSQVPRPVTHFIPPPSPLQQGVLTKLHMIQRMMEKNKGRVRVQLVSGDWVEGKVVQLSKSDGTMTLLGPDQIQNLMHLADVVRLRAPLSAREILESDEALSEIRA
ncbi:MAG: hypothetical protein HY395_00250 [Candidatus Doudnabacteria bacterium]|nr:hypothetical protein [Candidatus Doudnabacteria bacterium]